MVDPFCATSRHHKTPQYQTIAKQFWSIEQPDQWKRRGDGGGSQHQHFMSNVISLETRNFYQSRASFFGFSLIRWMFLFVVAIVFSFICQTICSFCDERWRFVLAFDFHSSIKFRLCRNVWASRRDCSQMDSMPNDSNLLSNIYSKIFLERRKPKGISNETKAKKANRIGCVCESLGRDQHRYQSTGYKAASSSVNATATNRKYFRGTSQMSQLAISSLE